MDKRFYAVVIAGGQGTRLWPLSRSFRPKQFLKLAKDGQSLIQAAVARATRVVCDVGRVLVVAPLSQGDLIREQLPHLPAENLILEPVGRNTAAAIGLAAAVIYGRNPDGVMSVLPADHLFQDETPWIDALQTALEFAAGADQLVTIGLEPVSPSPNYGYLHLGANLPFDRDLKVFRVQKFVEKPSVSLAQEYLKSGQYLWNTGTFAWKLKTIFQQFEKYLPDHWAAFQKLIENPDSWDLIARVYPGLENISIDYGVLEKSADVVVVKANFERIDLGNLANLSDLAKMSDATEWSSDESGNTWFGNGLIADSRNSLIYNDALDGITIAFGLKDVILIRQDDVVIALPKNEAHRIKDLLSEMRKEHKEEFL